MSLNLGEKVLVEAEIVEINNGAIPYHVEIGDKRFWFKKVQSIPPKTYEDGLHDAWKAAQRICTQMIHEGLSGYDLNDIFGSIDADYILMNFTSEEAFTKIQEWEKAHRIDVNDVVMGSAHTKGIVTKILYDEVYVIWDDGSCGRYKKDNVKKTGSTIDIASILAQIQE